MPRIPKTSVAVKLPPEVEERVRAKNEALSSMKPALRKVADDINSSVTSTAHKTVMFYWSTGLKVKKVRDDESKNGEKSIYGTGCVAQLAESCIIDKSLIYKSLAIVDKWPNKGDIESLLSRRTSSDDPITISHLFLLASVDAPRRLEELTDKVFTKSLSVRDLKSEISKHGKSTVSATASAKPKGIAGGLTNMASMAEKLADKLENDFSDVVFGQLSEIDSGEATPGLVEKMKRAYESVDKLFNDLTKSRDKLSRELARLETAAAEAAAEAEEVEAEAEESDDEEEESGLDDDEEEEEEEETGLDYEDGDEDFEAFKMSDESRVGAKKKRITKVRGSDEEDEESSPPTHTRSKRPSRA